MGALANCKKTPVPVEEVKETVLFPVFTHKEKINAKKIMICFYILHFRKKARELNRKTTSDLEIMVKGYEKETLDLGGVNTLTKKFDEVFDSCAKRISKLKIENEVEDLKKFKDLSLAKDEIKNYYIKQLEKHHMNLFVGLIEMIKEKESAHNNVLEGVDSKSSTKDSKTPKNSDKKDAIALSLSTLGKKNNPKKPSIAFVSGNKNNNYPHDLKKETSSDYDKLSKELDLLFNYNNNFKASANSFITEDKNNSVFLNFYVEDGGYPNAIKKFVNKFFFLALMKKSEYIRNTSGKYIKIAKKEIKRRLREKNFEELEKDEIVQENYNGLFDMINKSEKENNNRVALSLIKKEKSQDANNQNQASNAINLKNSTNFSTSLRRKSQGMSKENFNIDHNPTSGLKSNPSLAKSLGIGKSGRSNLKIKSENASPLKQTKINEEIHSSDEEKEESDEDGKDNAELDKKVASQIKELQMGFNKKAKKGFGIAAVKSKGPPNDNKPNLARAVKDKNLPYEFYNGEYDMLNYLYCGTGTLAKNGLKKYIYNGTFRMGKKNGVGIIFRVYPDNAYFYYRGEWANNKQDGYGFSLEIDDQESRKVYRRGNFEKGIFMQGSQITIEEHNAKTEILIEKYEGEVLNSQFSGWGTLTRKNLKLNKFYEKYDIEYEYKYEGNFTKQQTKRSREKKKSIIARDLILALDMMENLKMV